jgi:dienelactone hydrolase
MLACFFGLVISAPVVSPSQWDKHVAEISNGNKYQKACIPYKLAPKTKIKGLIVLYHGYTACPSSFKDTASKLVENGFMILAPLLPGHGVRFSYGCEKKDSCIDNRDNPSLLPATKEEYQTWTDWSLKMVKEQAALIPSENKEDGFFVGGMGHSAGGAVVQYAIAQPESPISRALVVNPYFLFSNPALDFAIKDCLSKKPEEQVSCLKSYLKASLKGESKADSDSLSMAGFMDAVTEFAAMPISDRMLKVYDDVSTNVFKGFQLSVRTGRMKSKNKPYSWGESCYKAKAMGRGGICSFRIKNIGALTDFGNYAISLVDKVPKSVIYGNIHSDRDGPTRDSVAAAVVKQLSSRGVKATRCRYKIAEQCSLSNISAGDNLCGMPHSCFSEPEAQVVLPNKRGEWFEDLQSNIVEFFSSSKPLGKKVATVDECESRSGTMQYGDMFDRLGVKLLEQSKKSYKRRSSLCKFYNFFQKHKEECS